MLVILLNFYVQYLTRYTNLSPNFIYMFPFLLHEFFSVFFLQVHLPYQIHNCNKLTHLFLILKVYFILRDRIDGIKKTFDNKYLVRQKTQYR